MQEKLHTVILVTDYIRIWPLHGQQVKADSILSMWFISFQLKTERERVSERMIRLGKKWEVEHLLWEEKERQKEVQMKMRETELLSSDKSYAEKLESVESRIALEKCSRNSEMNMFLAREKALMLNRLKPKENKFVPFTKDVRVVDAKFVLNLQQDHIEIINAN